MNFYKYNTMSNDNGSNDVLAPCEEYGFVYILKNKWMQGIVKIGKTSNIRKRMVDLYKTPVPETFTAEHVSKVRIEKMDDTEKALHAVFSEGRVNPKREFFLWDDDKADKAIKVLKLVEVQDVTDKVNGEMRSSLPADEAAAMENSEELIRRARRPNLDFHLLRINDGERLYWKDNQAIFVTVCSERKVIFNGKKCYLTTATKEILGTTAPIAPAPYWLYEGRCLKDIYDSFYEPTDGTDSADEV